MRDQASVDAAVAAAIERLGGLDVLINNAGLGTPQSAALAARRGRAGRPRRQPLGPWRVTAAALPALRESRGRVINVASGLAHMTVPFATAYTLSKRGVVAYSDCCGSRRATASRSRPSTRATSARTIHEHSTAAGVPLEGAVPAERVEDAARTLARAALGPPARDLATTRQRHARLRAAAARCRAGSLDRFTLRAMRRLARRGPLRRRRARGEYAQRLSTGGPRPRRRSARAEHR